MLWPLILPFKITSLVIGGFIAAVLIFAPALGWQRSKALLWSLLLGAVLFIPSCMVVEKCVDKTRFGGFAYPNFAAVANPRVVRWLPPSAQDITGYCASHGHRARFQIGKDALITWLNGFRSRFGKGDDAKPLAIEDLRSRRMEPEYFNLWFGNFGWECPPDFIEMDSPRAPNGAGFTVWYSETQGTAYLRAGYW
jgi:hypothetical protein